jgi:hypothetical protein
MWKPSELQLVLTISSRTWLSFFYSDHLNRMTYQYFYIFRFFSDTTSLQSSCNLSLTVYIQPIGSVTIDQILSNRILYLSYSNPPSISTVFRLEIISITIDFHLHSFSTALVLEINNLLFLPIEISHTLLS